MMKLLIYYQVKRRKELDEIKLRRVQANAFEKYIYETGIATSFQLIFAELITKNIPVKEYYTYTASRLREFGREMDKLKNNNKQNIFIKDIIIIITIFGLNS